MTSNVSRLECLSKTDMETATSNGRRDMVNLYGDKRGWEGNDVSRLAYIIYQGFLYVSFISYMML